MLKEIFKMMFKLLSLPIKKVLWYGDLKSTADYVEKHMKNVDCVSSKLKLLTMALGKATLDNNKLICEFGVYTGYTINHIASLANQTVFGFDSFEGLPERWRTGFPKGTFAVGKLPQVQPNVVLLKGYFDKTLPVFLKDHDKSIGFIHVDCDLYSSTKIIFELLKHRIHSGCIIVFDEYFNYPGWINGEYRAFHEFLEHVDLEYEYIGYTRFGEQVAVRIKSS